MHAFVMALLFRRAGPRKILCESLTLTWEHARNLGGFVFLYKSLVCILNRLRRKKSKLHNFIAGALIGLLIFGRKTNVNQQIVLYLFSRNILGIINNLMSKGVIPKFKFFPYLASFVWGLVMFLFEDDKRNLQPSLAGSMQFLYKDSDKKLTNITQLIPLEVPTVVERFWAYFGLGGSGD